MADYTPKFTPGEAVSMTVGADVTGQRLVAVSGSKTISPAGADAANVIGVAGFDAVAGDRVTVYTRAGGIHRLVANGAITAGAKVISATGGKVATIGAGANPIGIALQTAVNDLDVIDVLFL
jgi:hypothetical protein